MAEIRDSPPGNAEGAPQDGPPGTGADPVELVHVIRDPMVECVHRGHVAIWHADAGLVAAWGNPRKRILPRSAMKMIQALPLVESGAADAAGLAERRLALSCASHSGAALHVDEVTAWLAEIGRTETDLRCGPQWPDDEAMSHDLIRRHAHPDQRHNNCSGKHSGFLTLARHLGAGPEYLDIAHPVQTAVRAALEDLAQEECPDYAIDGCSAPNFAVTLSGFARALAAFAVSADGSGRRDRAMDRLTKAMMAHPEQVSGPGRDCTLLMQAARGRAAVKTGAEGVYAAILPEQRIGIALKIEDGATRASAAVVAQLLVGAGVLDAADPVALRLARGAVRNRRDTVVGRIETVGGLAGWRP